MSEVVVVESPLYFLITETFFFLDEILSQLICWVKEINLHNTDKLRVFSITPGIDYWIMWLSSLRPSAGNVVMFSDSAAGVKQLTEITPCLQVNWRTNWQTCRSNIWNMQTDLSVFENSSAQDCLLGAEVRHFESINKVKSWKLHFVFTNYVFYSLEGVDLDLLVCCGFGRYGTFHLYTILQLLSKHNKVQFK